ncbi:programmed cell death protein 2-like isoform X2 [Physella acuta]|nr:programmed cell death protein 2-like isoform X2 [Physella acuta]
MAYDESYDRSKNPSKQKLNVSDASEWGVGQDDWGQVGQDDWGDGSNEWSEDEKCGEALNGDEDQEIDEVAETPPHLGNLVQCQQTLSSENPTALNSGQAEAVDNLNTFSELRINDISADVQDQPQSSQPEGRSEVADRECFGDVGEPRVVMEDFVVPDTERWTAMTQILNTECPELSESVAVGKKPVVFKAYYLNVIDEPRNTSFNDEHVENLIRTYEKNEGKPLGSLLSDKPNTGKGKVSTESYEKTELKHGDKIFHKFLKRLQRCPEQIIRYEREGEPLFINKLEGTPSIASCTICGYPRVFELQLLPPLIPWLKSLDGTETKVEFGTVLIFTCKNNCWSDELDFVEESILFQNDPDNHLFR